MKFFDLEMNGLAAGFGTKNGVARSMAQNWNEGSLNNGGYKCRQVSYTNGTTVSDCSADRKVFVNTTQSGCEREFAF